MPREAVGGLVLLVATLFCVAAWRAFRANRGPASLALIMGAGFLLRAFAASDLYLHDWDERYHALVAKHLAAHPLRPTLYEDPLRSYDSQDWTANHVWLHKEPLSLWLVALSMTAFGTNELALRLPSVLLSTLAIGMTYAIGREIGGRRVALVAAFLHAVNGFLIGLAAGRAPSDHIDTLFIVLMEGGVLLAVRRRGRSPLRTAVAIGCVAGIAALAKSPFSLLLVLIWLPLIGGDRRAVARLVPPALVAIAVAALVYIPWQAYTSAAFPTESRWERFYSLRHLTEAIEGHGGGALFHLARIPRYFGELAWLPIAWFLLTLRGKPRNRVASALVIWLAIPYAFFSLVATKMPAYVMISAPAVFIIVALHWWRLSEIAGAARGLTRWAAVAAMVLLVALPVRFGLEKVKPLWGPGWDASWSPSLKRAATRLAGRRTVVFNTPRPIELMFYSSAVAYADLPTEADLARAERAGYDVALFDDGRLPEWLGKRAGILHLSP